MAFPKVFMFNRKRKAPREIIENAGSVKKEHSFMKYSGENLKNTTLISGSWWTISNILKERLSWRMHNKAPYMRLHTHPYGSEESSAGLPSELDVKMFLYAGRSIKSAAVAQQDPGTKKVLGYTILRRTKNTPILIREYAARFNKKLGKRKYCDVKELNTDLNEYGDELQGFYARDAIDDFANKYNLNVKFLPAKGYEMSRIRGTFYPKKETKNLETKVGWILGIIFTLSILFVSFNMTGFAIANLSVKTSNFIGVGLFILGVVGSCFCFRKR